MTQRSTRERVKDLIWPRAHPHSAFVGPPAERREGSVVLVGGSERRSIELVAYDPTWVAVFRAHAQTVCAALGSVAIRIEHIGSTAVPGLDAKPIVDILVTVAAAMDRAAYVSPLQQAGYVVRVLEPDHTMLRTPDLTVHLHVVSDSDRQARDYLRFRDRLRASAADRDTYASVKQELARRDWPTMNDYAEAKSHVIRGILARASCPVPNRLWRGSAGQGDVVLFGGIR